MTPAELHADTLHRNGEMVKMTLADFSDQDMQIKPCDGAKNADWQLGHLIRAEAMFLNLVGGAAPELPAGFADKYKTPETAAAGTPATKEQLLTLFSKVRSAWVEFARSATQQQLDQPTPEKYHFLAPTIGHLVLMMPLHAAMHVGQFQVIRRKLGKPVLF